MQMGIKQKGWQNQNRKPVIILVCIFSISLVCAFTFFEQEPYQLKYPVNFGGRFTIPEDNPLTREGVALGRMLFYEELLSANNKISCASCHQQTLAFSDNRQFSVGVDGTPTRRNSMSLSNLLWVKNFFWDGRSTSLEAQAVVPLTDPHEMGQSLETSSRKLNASKNYPSLFEKAFGTPHINADRIVKALAQFERTLISANSKYDQYLTGNYQPTESELRGIQLFSRGMRMDTNQRGGNCLHCHSIPKTFSETFHNNGLDEVPLDFGREDFTGMQEDRARFRVPTLRNIEVTGPYMHDGRFKTLREVLDHYSDHIKPSATLSPFIAGVTEQQIYRLALTAEEKQDIVNFMLMLTDTDFLNNPEFSDPERKTNKP